ncbi:ribosomal protein S18 acetylase RimI-like enzyme [Streptomyces sp. 1114.5]|uniref:GNAT family N-acetyltransferase n=1 Tax=unclassified Streptomyces TaxID=2593676 RepID=UPI000BD39E03|nr:MULTISPECIES: GNAT family N-acetyltransferase [unclassified Streptomyces]RKT19575.1 ribosomal protein S18 acetylase RimI-like enzyme [Streptomyces sp. 1114.5]SOB85770.1 Ribosomal protein S18 acetylase RimI [Streptomyces sp. 1331.2]
MEYRIERIGREDWQLLRKVRLAQLLDTPLAFGETHEYASYQGEGNWRARTNWVNEPDKIGLVAVAPDGEWVGTMLSVPSKGQADAVDLIGVWVAPEHRGRARGVADALLDAVLAWARGRGAARMLLGVHEANPRAAAFYQRRGFAYTGGETPYVLDASARILEMALPLD